jgi:hypothetical protein
MTNQKAVYEAILYTVSGAVGIYLFQKEKRYFFPTRHMVNRSFLALFL